MDTTGLEDRSSAMQFNLSAWEQWIVDKAKEERIRNQQKAMEVHGTECLWGYFMLMLIF